MIDSGPAKPQKILRKQSNVINFKKCCLIGSLAIHSTNSCKVVVDTVSLTCNVVSEVKPVGKNCGPMLCSDISFLF